MADEIQSLVLEQLRHIRRVTDDTRVDIADVKSRLTTVKSSLGQVFSQIANLQTLLAGQAVRMDRIDERFARVERRLDLAEA